MNNFSHPQRYDDIINLPRPVSKHHARMSTQNRAASFMPFAALNGHHSLISHLEQTVDNYDQREIIFFDTNTPAEE